ncbi:uncharacterized protein LOC130965342 [Arachis stenosperma]|uniref:uncharacterized protein LOC130965342 n=1 Tax=Arachis stenosperma TaxID=217475 RepID=UPI0025AB905C|nr:uncharacterized protein LOC130965342 [Arachis stenosperma]
MEERETLQGRKKKVRTNEGGFTGDQLLTPREEEWMVEDLGGKKDQVRQRSFAQTVKNGPTENNLEDDFMSSEEEGVEGSENVQETEQKTSPEIRVEAVKEGLYNIIINETTERRLWKPWWNTLIVKLLGRKVGYAAMKRRLETMWGRKGCIDVIDLGQEYYLVKFYSMEDFDFALLEGPWKIYDHYLTVRMWEPNFNPLIASIDKVTAWIRLPGLPIEMYDRMVLRKIENLVGRTIKVDSNTAELSRGKFARMCVEVDLTKPLVGKYLINGREYRVEYEGIHQICFSCGRIDHDQKLCPLKVAQNNVPSVQGEREKELPEKDQMSDKRNNKEDGKKLDKGKQVMQESQENFGDWMVVQRPKKGRKGQEAGSSKTKETSTKTENKSKFSVLHIEEVNEEITEGENREKSEGKKEKEKGKKDNAKGKRVKFQQKKPETQRENREGKGIGGANNVEQQQHTLNT